MLSSLHIENVAVIKKTNIEFGGGLNVLTGETGAGKSILVDSINLILGGKTSTDIIRSGENKAYISAMFSEIDVPISKAGELDVSADDDGCLYITRELDSDGKSKSKISGRPVALSFQKDLSSYLITVHGQSDNRLLMFPSAHLEYLDSYCNNKELREEYLKLYGLIEEYNKKIKELSKDAREKERTIELLKYQIEDIGTAKLKEGEEDELIARKERVKNSGKISKQASVIYRALYRNEKSLSAYELVKKALIAIEVISDFLPKSEEYIEKLNEIKYVFEDIGLTAADLLENEYGDPDKELDLIESRLDQISKLERKYGSDISEILQYKEKAEKELSEIELSDILLSELRQKLIKAEKEAIIIANKLSLSRKKASEELEAAIIKELAYLDMPKVNFKVEIKQSCTSEGKIKFLKTGTDVVEFFLSANPGEPLKPLVKIASGGELSRIMLALKSVNAADAVGETLIFDEIDTGVSGKTSQKIGMKLRALSKNNQVICVTHSAQIAAEAHHHFLIKKSEVDGRVETTVEELNRDGRIKEIARIMGGVNITEKLLDSATEMLDSVI